MRIVLQRVSQARVTVGGEWVASIGAGLLALVAIAGGDTEDDVDHLAAKTVRMRLFPSGDRPFHKSVGEVGGAVLAVSQFTLLGDVRRGNRPSWAEAAAPEDAAPLIDRYADEIERLGIPVSRGQFGEDMTVTLENDGPVTVLLDSAEMGPRRAGTSSAR